MGAEVEREAGVRYHPDPTINAELIEQSIEAERFDLAVGYPPRAWTCSCGATHSRGHHLTIGTHRCLRCGYVGTAGVMHGSALGGAHERTLISFTAPADPREQGGER